ncbi:30S ribosomal protein S1 [Gemmata sp. SH-PL17]|uniref:Tex-like N-terminal domain-containing protein n=1 Tax=Gemmata sp. SH-PL17 TaxID=1630693 RepID=UPI00078DB1A7|nr:Tex family protein [Gemmata sp. SH-PL17]AMV27330.1 30S ribosomal protein S1 [Gemmata sp. SH-PL17]
MTPSDPTTNVPADSSAPATDAAPTQPTEEPVAPAESSTAPPVESTAPAEPTAEGAAPAEAAPPPAHREPALPAQPVPDVPPAPQPHDLSRIAQDLQIRKAQVEAVVQLLDDENTVPFITRYRKERTGGLNEDVIRRIQDRVTNLRALTDRKRTILKSIAFQGKLNDALTQAILAAEAPKRLEDLYLPFKPKKKSLATEAREKGLGPLAEAIFNRDPAVDKLDEVVQGLVDPDKWLLNTDDVMAGVRNILADMVADFAEVRGPLRAFSWDTGVLVSIRGESVPESKGKEYEPYFDFREPVKDIPPHRVLAINRGEKAGVLKVRIDTDPAMGLEITTYHLGLADHPHRGLMLEVAKDALERLLKPSLEREIRRELTDRAQEHAVMVFAKNLRSLLLQPPLRGRKVLAVDPGIRTGCKLAVLDETGKLLEDAVIYPHGQKKNATDAKRKMEQLVRKYQLSVVAIGNGTGCRDTEQLVADLISDLADRRLNPVPDAPQASTLAPEAPVVAPTPQEPVLAPVVTAVPAAISLDSGAPVVPTEAVTLSTEAPAALVPAETTTTHPEAAPAPSETLTTGAPETASVPVAPAAPAVPPPPPISLEGLPDAPEDLAYVIVIEAGASDYSASPVAREEFPDLDATTRGTISIGRRLQDPLAELVKIDPQHIGVGLYQHDVKPKFLKESLEGVIESSVNQVGVDLNTASVPLLRHVSGLNQLVAREIVTYREKQGAFANREQLLQVPGLGEKRFTQAAGFLKLPDGPDPLDSTWIHPESYPLARQVLSDFGLTPADLRDKAKVEELRAKLNGANLAEIAGKLNVGEPTLDDIFASLARPGRDPREDLPPPIFKTGVLRLEDITQGMELKGTVLNVVPFGAFVDIGLKESGLVHISQMANRYIKSPYDVVSVGDVVTVWVMDVKAGEKKISLSMIPPGQERRPQERGPARGGHAPREQRAERPQQSARPAPQEQRERPPQPARDDRGGNRGGYPQRGGFQPRQGQGQGGGRFNRGPAPANTNPPASAQPAEPVQPLPPKKPSKPKPLPNLTPEKKAGKAALNTFGELLAFFKPVEPEAPKVEEPKPEAKAEEPKPEEPKTEGQS